MSFILYEYLIYSYYYSQNFTNYERLYSTKVYSKNFLDRCIIYSCVSFIFNKNLHFLFCIPNIQNVIPLDLSKYYIILVRYIICKNIIAFIRRLDKKIIIKNYAIKDIMDNFKPNDFKKFIQTCATVYIMKFLKIKKYKYYKAIKFVYYCETNQLFKDYTRDENIYIINNTFNKISPDVVDKIEFINALVSLIGDTSILFYFLYFKLFKISFLYYISLNLFPLEYFPFITFVIIFHKDLLFYTKFYSFLKNEFKN